MDKRWLIIGVGAGAISLGLITSGVFDESLTPPQTEPEAEHTNTSAEPTPSNLVIPSNSESITSANSLAQAKEDVVSAQFALEKAEEELDGLESEIDEVERYIEGLEQQGQNPAEFAEEGMLLLRPVIEKYEEKLALVEVAEKQLEEAKRVLSGFEQ
ncbi:hypothetical protein NBRC116493_13540 [Aurantivibrio infirmus]